MEQREGPPDPDAILKAAKDKPADARGSLASATSEAKPAAEAKPADKPAPSVPATSGKAAAVPPRPSTPAQPARAKLHVIRALGDGPILHELRADETTVGRDADVPVPGDKFVSPKHAKLAFRGGKLELEDMDSLNGTFLRIRQPVELELGDIFVAGDQVFRVEANPPPNDGPDASPTYFYSSPKWPTTFRLVQMWESGMPGLTIVARGSSLQIGRTGSELSFPNDFWLNDAHCLVEDQGGFLMLTDLGSRGGTFVKVKAATRLTTGDEILVGRTRLRAEIVTRQSGAVVVALPS